MRRVLSALVIAVLVSVPSVAAAQSATDLIGQVDSRGYATDPGVAVDINQLEATARDLNADGVALVLLSSEFPNGNDILAVDIVEQAEREWTVLVLSAAGGNQLDVGYASAGLTFDRLDPAADAAFDQPSRDPLVFAEAFAAALGSAGASSAGGAAADSDGGGGGNGLILFLGFILIVGLVLFVLSRRSKSDVAKNVEAAKGELADDLAAVANDILELGERADVKGNAEASEHYRTANEIYLEVDDGLNKADSLDEVDDLDDALELAGWHLDVAEAIVNGDPIPDKPRTEEVWEADARPAADSLPSGAGAGRTQRRAPAPAGRAELPQQFPRPAPRRRGGGGGLGNVLGGILGGVLSSGGLGGGGRRPQRSRGGIGSDINLGGPRGRSGGGLRPAPRSRPSGGSTRRPSTPRRSAAGRGRRRG